MGIPFFDKTYPRAPPQEPQPINNMLPNLKLYTLIR